jgi:hypothetical protein
MMMMMMIITSVEQLVEWELARETQILAENLPPVPFYEAQIPHDLTWGRILTAAMGIRRLTA